jgi:hypothetical protein
VAALTDPITPDQQTMIELVWDVWTRDPHCRWPIYQYVDGTLRDRARVDFEFTLASLPLLQHPERFGEVYRAVRVDRAGNSKPAPNAPVRLTLAALHHLADTDGLAARYLELLRHLAARRGATAYDPFKVVLVPVERVTVARLNPRRSEVWLHRLHILIAGEPPTHDVAPGWESGTWWHDLHPAIRDYADVADTTDYLTRLALDFRPRILSPTTVPGPRALVASIDYLSATWQARFKTDKPLVRARRLDTAAKLALPAPTEEVFESALSALSDVLAHLTLPDQPGAPDQHPATRLGAFLIRRLPDVDKDRVERAVRTLTQIKSVRHGSQHDGAASEAAQALRALGIGYPIRDYATAWEQIRAAAIGAFEALREEIEASERSY